ncbi:hypothetical protein [Actinoplanes sp. NPDC051859]|uniref:hypothetical protein n=1 Tax=Actinoplanes sp. NPDC051859 TaxID=3363909 RepID=UPI0037B98FE9
MTTYTPPAGSRLVVRDHTITGTASQLANLIANHRSAGTLVALTAPRPVTDDRYQIIVRLREPAPTRSAVRVASVSAYTRTRVRSTHPKLRVAVIATAVAGATAGFLAAVAYLLGQLVEFVTAHAGPILGVLALALIGAGLFAGRSGRRHCPGC